MLDWIFGSSKATVKQQIKPEDKLDKEEAWVYDFIRQYLMSPIWRNPLLDFIEENCSVFEDTEQNKFQYTKIFQEFISICSILIESIVEETGITFKTLEKCIVKGLRSREDKKIYTQILICDNFQMFKKIMVSKNKELEVEALKKIRQQNKKEDKVQDRIDEAELQKLEIEQAIALSLALQQKAKQQEEQQFKQAIRQSQLETKKQEKKEEKKKEQKSSLLGDLPPLIINPSRNFQSVAEYKEQKEKLDKQITQLKSQHKEEQNTEQRKQRLQEQRELLRKRKQEERNLQLKTFAENKQATSIPQHKVTQEQLLKRKKLINRLKEQLKND